MGECLFYVLCTTAKNTQFYIVSMNESMVGVISMMVIFQRIICTNTWIKAFKVQGYRGLIFLTFHWKSKFHSKTNCTSWDREIITKQIIQNLLFWFAVTNTWNIKLWWPSGLIVQRNVLEYSNRGFKSRHKHACLHRFKPVSVSAVGPYTYKWWTNYSNSLFVYVCIWMAATNIP
jgi:hypothetical protein